MFPKCISLQHIFYQGKCNEREQVLKHGIAYMKILQIINSLNTGGAEKLLLDTIPLYRKAGVEMDLLVLWDNNCPFMQQLRDTGCCKIHVLRESGNYKDVYNPAAIFKMRSILGQYDIAHVHLFPAQYFAVFANQLNGNKTKLLFTEHNTSNRRIKTRKYRLFERFIYGRYKCQICISPEIETIYQNYLGSAVARAVIPNGVDISSYADAKPIEKGAFFSADDFLLIQVSGFREQKDQPTLIRSLRHLPSNIKLLLAGDGALRKSCEQLTQELGLQHRVKFLGVRTDIPALLKTSDVVVLSSAYEGLSLSSIEGMAARPFVASDVPGLRETAKGYGLLFKQGDAEALAAQVLKLYEDNDFYRQIATRCLARAQEFDISIMVEKHIDLYHKMAGKA